ncbi:hypothetical protein SAMN05216366_10260 [Selenomonas ruminantium]|uniref:DUF1146 domain-containing protein n=1 Tax=Selenomonas ruminantium TaxID=971 RepID=A0A1H0MVB5_SELRU|nr:hypothetical protein SAMN05216366_10260 [Selenomonas ruminantium]
MVALLFLLFLMLLFLVFCLIIFFGWKFARRTWPQLSRVQTALIMTAVIFTGIAVVIAAMIYEFFNILSHLPHG